jgi:hypothetical protein
VVVLRLLLLLLLLLHQPWFHTPLDPNRLAIRGSTRPPCWKLVPGKG